MHAFLLEVTSTIYKYKIKIQFLYYFILLKFKFKKIRKEKWLLVQLVCIDLK